jgi:hypothetical protein
MRSHVRRLKAVRPQFPQPPQRGNLSDLPALPSPTYEMADKQLGPQTPALLAGGMIFFAR